jgi:[ribosomal protein S5]-alanine N-acetyltransferase
LQPILAHSLVLEPLVVGHAQEMFSILSDPAIYEFENAPPTSEAALARRYALLEERRSKDGNEAWLNWAVRMPSGELAGYVQATVLQSGAAYLAYELGSRHWRRGIGSRAVPAMMEELRVRYGVTLFIAVFKTANFRSRALLNKLGFEPASDEQNATFGHESDELVMVKTAGALRTNRSGL